MSIYTCQYIRLSIYTIRHRHRKCLYIQPIAFGVSFHLILQSHPKRSYSNGTRQKRRKDLDNRLSFEIGDMTLQWQ